MSKAQQKFPGSDFFSELLNECQEITRNVEELDQPGVLILGSKKKQNSSSDDSADKENSLDSNVSDLFSNLSDQLGKIEQRMSGLCRQATVDKNYDWDDWMDKAAECYRWINKESVRIEEALVNREDINYDHTPSLKCINDNEFGPLTRQEQYQLERQASAKKKETEKLKQALRAEMMHDLPKQNHHESHKARDYHRPPPTQTHGSDDCKRNHSDNHVSRDLHFTDAMLIDNDASGHASDVEMDICTTESSSPAELVAPSMPVTSAILSPPVTTSNRSSVDPSSHTVIHDSVMHSTPSTKPATFQDSSHSWLPKTPNLEDFGLEDFYRNRQSESKRRRFQHRSSIGRSHGTLSSSIKDIQPATVCIDECQQPSPVMPPSISGKGSSYIQTPKMPKSIEIYGRMSAAKKLTLSVMNNDSELSTFSAVAALTATNDNTKSKMLRSVNEDEIAGIPGWMRKELGTVAEINQDIERVNQELQRQGISQLGRDQLSDLVQNGKSLLMFLTETKRLVPRWMDGDMKYIIR